LCSSVNGPNDFKQNVVLNRGKNKVGKKLNGKAGLNKLSSPHTR